VLAVVATAAPTSHTRSYSITDLGTLGGPSSSAFGINNRGQIVGGSDVSGGSVFHAFLYSHGQMIDLFPGSGSSFSGASDINNRGQIVGSLGSQAFLYRHGQVTLIGFPGATHSGASAINDRGAVVGASELSASSSESHAFLYRHGRIIDLTPTDPRFGAVSSAQDINDRGDVVGFVSPEGDLVPDPFLWSKGTLTSLPVILPGDDIAIATSINNSGEIVANSLSTRTFEPHAGLLSHGRLISIGPGVPVAINNRGQVIGYSSASGTFTAFLYQNGVRIELSTLLPAGSGWTSVSAEDINDRGQIVGSGIHNGDTHAFLLSPH
jgi:probable HAF family extracellular repeat protein